MITDFELFAVLIPEILLKLYGLEPSIEKFPKEKSIRLRLYNKKLFEFKRDVLGLPAGSKSIMKSLPSCIIETGNTNTKNLIAGIFDTDGCFKVVRKEGKFYPRATISNKSLILGEIKNFLERNGVPCSISINKDTKANVLYINGNKNVDTFFELIPIRNVKHLDRYSKWKEFVEGKRARGLAWIERLASEVNSSFFLKKPI